MKENAKSSKPILALIILSISVIALLSVIIALYQWNRKDDSMHSITFPAYEEDNADNNPNLDKANHTSKFHVYADFPDGWTVREQIADDEITVPGEFYTPSYHL